MKKLSAFEYEIIRDYAGHGTPCIDCHEVTPLNKRTGEWNAVRDTLINRGYLNGEDCQLRDGYHVWPTKFGRLAINIYEVCRSLEVA